MLNVTDNKANGTLKEILEYAWAASLSGMKASPTDAPGCDLAWNGTAWAPGSGTGLGGQVGQLSVLQGINLSKVASGVIFMVGAEKYRWNGSALSAVSAIAGDYSAGERVSEGVLAAVLATSPPEGTWSEPADTFGCRIQHKAGRWFGDFGTWASKTALTTAIGGQEARIELGSRASLPSGPVTWRGAGSGGWVSTVPEKIAVQLRSRMVPVTPLSVTVSEGTTKDAGATIQIAATQGSVSNSADWNPANSRFSWFHSGKYGVLGTNADANYITGRSVSYSTPSCNLLGMSFILYGSDVSILVAGKGGKVAIKVDDEYVSATPLSIASDGNLHYIRLQLPGSGPYRIDVRGTNAPMGGVWIPPTSSIMPAPRRGRKMVIAGDSFTESSVETYGGIFGYCATIADLIGWDDVCPSGIGGTGYAANTSGTRKNLLERFDDDVLALQPSVLMLAMGINDNSYPYATVVANAEACIVKAVNAGIEVIVCAPFWAAEIQRVTMELLAIETALKALAAKYGCQWISALEPVGTDVQPITTTLVEAASSGATTIKTAIKLTAGSTWKFPDGTRFHVKTTSSGAPSQTVLNSGIQTAQANGNVITQIASSHWTGTGRTGAPTGYGTCDILVGDGAGDSTHPSTAGYKVLGYELARQIGYVYR